MKKNIFDIRKKSVKIVNYKKIKWKIIVEIELMNHILWILRELFFFFILWLNKYYYCLWVGEYSLFVCLNSFKSILRATEKQRKIYKKYTRKHSKSSHSESYNKFFEHIKTVCISCWTSTHRVLSWKHWRIAYK